MAEETRLPTEFSDLQDFADRFAIGDDLLRQSATDNASLEERRKLVDSVWPRLPSINAFLDNHDDDSAHLLGRLAEAACEVAIEIGQPSA